MLRYGMTLVRLDYPSVSLVDASVQIQVQQVVAAHLIEHLVEMILDLFVIGLVYDLILVGVANQRADCDIIVPSQRLIIPILETRASLCFCSAVL